MRHVLVLIAAALGASAQSADWVDLRDLTRGQRLSARNQNGGWVHGRFASWDRRPSRSQTVGLYGAGIGSAIGALVGGTKDTTVYRAERQGQSR